MHSKILVLFFALTLGLFAIQGAISVYPVEKEHLFVSEEVILKVDLKTDAFSIRDAKIGLENSKDYVVVAPKSAAFLETVDINDTDWQVVHYEYKLYPLHAGKIRIAPIDIAFKASMGYGQPENNFTFQSEALFLNVSAPQGIGKDLFVLSTSSYTLKSDISPKFLDKNVTEINIGNAIELKITQEAKNVPDILLAPINFSKNKHLNIYKEEPVLQSKTLGNDTISTRIDAFTFLATNEGNVSIPSQILIWWDPVEKRLHRENTEKLDFTILPNPKLDTSLSTSSLEEKKNNVFIYSILFSLLFVIIIYILYPYLMRWRKEKKNIYIQSEEGRFEALLDTCEGKDMAKLYDHFYYWLEVADPKLLRTGFRGISEVQSSFSDSLRELEEALVSSEKTFDKMHFRSELKKLREALLKQQRVSHSSLPENINPL